MKSIKWRDRGGAREGRSKAARGVSGFYRFSVVVTRSGCTGKMFKRTRDDNYPAHLHYTINKLLHSIVAPTKGDCMKALEVLYLLTEEQK